MEILDSIISIKNSFLIYVDLIKFKLNTPGYLLATNSTSLKRMEYINFTPSKLLTFTLIILIYLFFIENKKFVKTKKYFLLIALFYTILKLIISYSSFLQLNQDSIAWIITSIRMDSLNTFEYLASWDHKGSTIYWIYILIFKYFKISNNLWGNFAIVFIFWSAFVSYFSYKYLMRNNLNKYSALIISFLMFLNLTFSPGEFYPVFDSRFIGSSFIFISIYYLTENKYSTSSIFLALSLLTLPTFALSAFAIFVLTIFKNLKTKNNRFLEIILPYVFVFFGYLAYLFFTSQFNEFVRLVIKFNLNLSGVGEYYPLTFVLQSNIYLFIFFGMSLLYSKKLYDKFGENFLIILIWSIFEIIHLVLTGPRFYQYDQLLVIPLSLIGYFSLYIVYDFLSFVKKGKNFTKFLFLVLTVIPISIFSYSVTTSLEIKQLKFDEVNSKIQEVIFFDRDSKIYQEEPELAIYYIDGKDWQEVITNYNFLPSTRYWQIFWNKRDSGWPKEFNWEKVVTEDEYAFLLYKDLNNENPKYAVVDKEYKSSHKNLLINYIEENYTLNNCEERYCIYHIK